MAYQTAYASCQIQTEVVSLGREVEAGWIDPREARRKTEIGDGSDRFRWNWRTAVVRESDPALLL